LADWNSTSREDKVDNQNILKFGKISKISKTKTIWKIRKIEPPSIDLRFEI